MRRTNKRKFGRVRKVRVSMFRSLVSSLLDKEAINTTLSKAKEIRPIAERLVTIAKKDTVANRKLVASRLGNPELIKKLFTKISPKYIDRNGGYTKIVKMSFRKSDGAQLARILFV